VFFFNYYVYESTSILLAKIKYLHIAQTTSTQNWKWTNSFSFQILTMEHFYKSGDLDPQLQMIEV